MDPCTLIRRNMYCSYKIEVLVYEMLSTYSTLISKDSPLHAYLKVLLYTIALDSKKHAELLELVGKAFNLFEEVECSQLVGEPWKVLQSTLEHLRRGVFMDLKTFVENQLWIEKAVGEETYQLLLLPLIKENAKMCGIEGKSLELVNTILERIIQDELFHENTLKRIKTAF
ncbi:MAG: hypothetical protein QXH02_05140 [Desulfurococcaceae archaeon]